MAAPKALFLMRLEEVPGEQSLHMQFDACRFFVTAPAEFNSFLCLDYDMSYVAADVDSNVMFHYTFTRCYDVFEYAVRNYVTSVNQSTLRMIAKLFGVALAKGAPQIDVLEALLNARGIDGPVKKNALDAIAEQVRIAGVRAVSCKPCLLWSVVSLACSSFLKHPMK